MKDIFTPLGKKDVGLKIPKISRLYTFSLCKTCLKHFDCYVIVLLFFQLLNVCIHESRRMEVCMAVKKHLNMETEAQAHPASPLQQGMDSPHQCPWELLF